MRDDRPRKGPAQELHPEDQDAGDAEDLLDATADAHDEGGEEDEDDTTEAVNVSAKRESCHHLFVGVQEGCCKKVRASILLALSGSQRLSVRVEAPKGKQGRCKAATSSQFTTSAGCMFWHSSIEASVSTSLVILC